MLLSKFNELGKKYCKLTVIERAENYKNGSVQWYCLCDCGNPNKIKVRASSLRDGHTKSCGCLSAETAKKIHTNKIVSQETREKCSKTLSGRIYLEHRSELGKKYPERGKYKRGSLIVRKVNNFIQNTKRRQMPCSLSKEAIATFFVNPCFYCGKPSDQTKYKEGSGIDRIDNSKGYIEGNCVSCCFFCNACKNERTIHEFREHIINMYKTFIEKNNDKNN